MTTNNTLRFPADNTIAPAQAVNFRRAPGVVMFGANFSNYGEACTLFRKLMGRPADDSEVRFFDDSADGKKEAARAIEMINTGRVQSREGINDTGKSLYERYFSQRGMPGASFESVISRLKGRGYMLKEMYLKQNKKGNWCLKFVFMIPVPGQKTTYFQSQLDAITDYLADPFDDVHIWDNRYGGGDSITINFKHTPFTVQEMYRVAFKSDTSYTGWAFTATRLETGDVADQPATWT